MATEIRVRKHKVIEYRDGCIFKTKKLELEWVKSDTKIYAPDKDGFYYTSLSTREMREMPYEEQFRG